MYHIACFHHFIVHKFTIIPTIRPTQKSKDGRRTQFFKSERQPQFSENGRRPQVFKNWRQPQFFKYGSWPQFFKNERPQFFKNERRPQLSENGRQPQFFQKRKTTSIFSKKFILKRRKVLRIHRWTIRIVLHWNTIPKAGIVLVLVDLSKQTNTNKNYNSKNISGNIVYSKDSNWA